MPRSNFGGKKNFLQNFILFHPFESINFQPAGFLALKEKSGPLLQPYSNITNPAHIFYVAVVIKL